MTISPNDSPDAELERAVRQVHMAGTAAEARAAMLGLIVGLGELNVRLLRVFEQAERHPQVDDPSWAQYGELVHQAVTILFDEAAWLNAQPSGA